MPSSQKIEDCLVEGLDSDIESVDSDLPQRFKIGNVEVCWIGFQGDLCVGKQDEVLSNLLQNVFKLLYPEGRGVPPPI